MTFIAFESYAVTTVLPVAMADLDGSRWYSMAYAATITTALLGTVLGGNWADRHGTHSVLIDKDSIDLLCVYCPDTRACYYVDPHTVNRTVCLRVFEARNQQQKRIRWAKDFTEIPATVLGVPAGSRRGLEDEPNVGQSLPTERP